MIASVVRLLGLFLDQILNLVCHSQCTLKDEILNEIQENKCLNVKGNKRW